MAASSKNSVSLSDLKRKIAWQSLFLVLIFTAVDTKIFSQKPSLRLAIVIAICFGAFLIFFLFSRLTRLLRPKPKKCPACSKPALDRFIVNGGQVEGTYCRPHLIEKFKQAFLAFTLPMVVFHPEQGRKYCTTMYPYFAIDEMEPKFSFSPEAVNNTHQILSQITGKCQECRKQPAQTAYFPLGILTWDDAGPLIEAVHQKPTLLCSNCLLPHIIPALQFNKNYYTDNGLFAPYKQPGVFVNTYL